MGRKAKFSDDDFLEAALELLSQEGPREITVAGLAAKVGAPVGSLYHRFGSRAQILARLWLRVAACFQKEFIRILDAGDAVEAAQFTVQWSRDHFNEAQTLLLYRREELADADWPQDILDTAGNLGPDLNEAMLRFTEKAFGKISEDGLRRALFAIVDIPFAAVYRHLKAGEKPPPYVDYLVKISCRAILEEP